MIFESFAIYYFASGHFAVKVCFVCEYQNYIFSIYVWNGYAFLKSFYPKAIKPIRLKRLLSMRENERKKIFLWKIPMCLYKSVFIM